MAQTTETLSTDWTAADLVKRFGPIPLCRIRSNPPPGSATENDIVRLHDREGRLYELVEGVLVEKTIGAYESYLAVLIGRLLGNFVAEQKLGIIMGADGMMRLAPGLVRIPDMSFISWDRLPDRKVPRTPIAELAPDLAVEVISKSNTQEEMQQKLRDYFAAGVQQVWYVYPEPREVRVYDSADRHSVFAEGQQLSGSELLPGFELDVTRYFADPE